MIGQKEITLSSILDCVYCKRRYYLKSVERQEDINAYMELGKAGDDMKFEKRTYRPALNNFNALLSNHSHTGVRIEISLAASSRSAANHSRKGVRIEMSIYSSSDIFWTESLPQGSAY